MATAVGPTAESASTKPNLESDLTGANNPDVIVLQEESKDEEGSEIVGGITDSKQMSQESTRRKQEEETNQPGKEPSTAEAANSASGVLDTKQDSTKKDVSERQELSNQKEVKQDSTKVDKEKEYILDTDSTSPKQESTTKKTKEAKDEEETKDEDCEALDSTPVEAESILTLQPESSGSTAPGELKQGHVEEISNSVPDCAVQVDDESIERNKRSAKEQNNTENAGKEEDKNQVDQANQSAELGNMITKTSEEVDKALSTKLETNPLNTETTEQTESRKKQELQLEEISRSMGSTLADPQTETKDDAQVGVRESVTKAEEKAVRSIVQEHQQRAVAGNVVDAVRVLRRINGIDCDKVEQLHECRRQRINFKNNCNRSLLRPPCPQEQGKDTTKPQVTESEKQPQDEEAGDDLFREETFDGGAGDEAFYNDSDSDSDSEISTNTQALAEEIALLKREAEHLVLEEDTVPQKVQEKVAVYESKRKVLRGKISRASVKARAVAKLRLTERKKRQERIRHKQEQLQRKMKKAVCKAKAVARFKLGEKKAREERSNRFKRNKVRMYNAGMKEARERRENRRQEKIWAQRKEKKATQAETLLLALRKMKCFAEGNQQQREQEKCVVPVAQEPVKSPLPDYWDGHSKLQGLVYTESGELCIWQGNKLGLHPELPSNLQHKLQRRELQLKQKWVRLQNKRKYV